MSELSTQKNIDFDEIIKFISSFYKEDKGMINLTIVNKLQSLIYRKNFFRGDLLRVGVVGEFKAGKSTFINTLLGRKVAAVDFFEMTGWVACYFQHDEELCVMKYSDHDKFLPLQEFVSKCENKNFTASDLDGLIQVDIGLKDMNLPFTIMDTPGMGTTNKVNEKILMNALDDVNVVLWTLDVTAIGSVREFGMIETLRSSGTPVICVVTKCDQAASDELEEVSEYLFEMTDFTKDQIFFVKDLHLGNRDNLSKIIEYFSSTLVPNTEKLRVDSFHAYQVRLKSTVKSDLSDLYNRLLIIKEKTSLFKERIFSVRDRTFIEIMDKTVGLCHELLFRKNEDELRNQFRQELKNNKEISESSIEDILSRVITEEVIGKFHQNLLSDISKELASEWAEKMEEAKEEFINLLQSFQEGTRIGIEGMLHDYQNNKFSTMLDDIYKGVGIVGGVSLLIAGYAAVLGPAAASLSFGGAVSIVGGPIAWVGLAGVAVYSFIQSKKRDEQVEQYLDVLIHGIKENFIEQTVKGEYRDYIQKLNSDIANKLCEEFESAITINLPDNDIELLTKRTCNYIKLLG